MLEASVSSLRDEIETHLAVVEEYLGDFDGDMEKLTGPAYHPSKEKSALSDPENFTYEWYSHWLPMVASGVPQVRVKTTRMGMAQMRAKAFQYAANHWAIDVRLHSEVEKLAADWATRWCVAVIKRSEKGGDVDPEDPPRWPSLRRWSPRRFVFDTDALDIESRQFQGHMVVRSRKDIEREARDHPDRKWNLDLISNLIEHRGNERGALAESPEARGVAQRDEVAYWEVHLPEFELPFGKAEKARHKADSWRQAGFNGTVFYVADRQRGSKNSDSDEDWLRPPQPYFGPRSGPYVTGGAYYVPDETVPLAPTVASRAQSDHANDVARAVEDGIRSYSRIVMVAESSPDLAVQIREGEHDNVYVVNVDDLGNKVASFEKGGVTQQMLVAQEDSRARYERVSGLSETMQGTNPGGDVTATSVAAVANAGARRIGFLANKFNGDFLSHCFRSAITLMAQDEDFTLELPGDQFGNTETLYLEGSPPSDKEGGSLEEIEALDISIEVFSSGLTDAATQQMRLANLDQTMATMAAAAPGVPPALYTDMDAYLAARAELTGMPEIASMFDARKQSALAMMLLGAEDAQPHGPGPQQPRISVDTGSQSVYAPTMKGRENVGKTADAGAAKVSMS